jgi:hypothetical protein
MIKPFWSTAKRGFEAPIEFPKDATKGALKDTVRLAPKVTQEKSFKEAPKVGPKDITNGALKESDSQSCI